jgi:hypothetical protein
MGSQPTAGRRLWPRYPDNAGLLMFFSFSCEAAGIGGSDAMRKNPDAARFQ